MPTERRLGKVIIKLGSARLETMPGATLDPGGETAATQIGSNEILGPSYTPKQSRLECTVSQGTSTSVDDFRRGEIVSYQFECDTGQLYSVAQAWLTEPPVLSAEGWRVIFEGTPAEEIR